MIIYEEEKFPIKTYEVSFDGKLRLGCLMNLFQNLAEVNITRLGYGYEFLISQGVCWVASNYVLDIYKLPERSQNVILRTWPCDKPSIFAIRDFLLTDELGNALVKATSRWFLINIERRRPVHHKKVIPDFPIHPQRLLKDNFEKIEEIQRVDFQREFDVTFDNLDVNMHANNAFYATWVSDAVPENFRFSHEIKRFEIAFKNEAKLGDKITIQTQIEDRATLHAIKCGDRIIADSKIMWKSL